MNLSRRSFLIGTATAAVAPLSVLGSSRAITTMDAGVFYAPYVPDAVHRCDLRSYINEWREYTHGQALEVNDTFFRARYREETRSIFELAKHQGVLYDFEVQCDERCNPPTFIERGGFRAIVQLRPMRAVHIIFLKAEFNGT